MTDYTTVQAEWFEATVDALLGECLDNHELHLVLAALAAGRAQVYRDIDGHVGACLMALRRSVMHLATINGEQHQELQTLLTDVEAAEERYSRPDQVRGRE